MIITDFCGSTSNPNERRKRYQSRKLEMLTFLKDSLERRLAAVNASINTLEVQINSTKE